MSIGDFGNRKKFKARKKHSESAYNLLKESLEKIKLERELEIEREVEVISYGDQEIENEFVKLPYNLVRETKEELQVALILENEEDSITCGFWFNKDQIRLSGRSFYVKRWLLKIKLLEAMEKGLVPSNTWFKDCPFVFDE